MPKSLVQIHGQLRRWAVDRITGRYRLFASHCTHPEKRFELRIALRQRIMRTESFDAKMHNISSAIGKIDNLVVRPGKIFSYWYLLGEATKENGYLPSRSLRNGELVQDYGGGLCQLAGIIYYLSLLADLKILERHSHSRDIYNEDERFAPLGSDASVAYGIKDLRVQNSFSFPIQFCFNIDGEYLVGHICADNLILERKIEFVRHDDVKSTRTVDTFAVSNGSVRQHISSSIYKIGATNQQFKRTR